MLKYVVVRKNFETWFKVFEKQIEESMVIITAGMIGVGKSTLTEILAKELGTKAFYEPVEGTLF